MTNDAYGAAGASVRPVEGPSPACGSQAFECSRAALSVEQILVWADAFHAAHGTWPVIGPGSVSRVVAGAPRELWKAINHALVAGERGLPGGSSLAELLAEHRGAPLPEGQPKAGAEKDWVWEPGKSPLLGPQRGLLDRRQPPAKLRIGEILSWADAHHAAHGRWPRKDTGPIEAAPGATWKGIDYALRIGKRGLAGGTSLVRLLVEHRGPDADHRLSRLTVRQILVWADAHHAATGQWPACSPVAVAGAPDTTWEKIDQALRRGDRGLAGGTSLARILARHRAPGNALQVTGLTVDTVLAWADAHHAATGNWPRKGTGPVRNGPQGVTWRLVNEALRLGYHGLTEGSSLALLLAEHREVRTPLTIERILAWADAHHADQGQWPRAQPKPVAAARGETWRGIDKALRAGSRGLAGGSSLSQLLVEHRGPEAGR